MLGRFIFACAIVSFTYLVGIYPLTGHKRDLIIGLALAGGGLLIALVAPTQEQIDEETRENGE